MYHKSPFCLYRFSSYGTIFRFAIRWSPSCWRRQSHLHHLSESIGRCISNSFSCELGSPSYRWVFRFHLVMTYSCIISFLLSSLELLSQNFSLKYLFPVARDMSPIKLRVVVGREWGSGPGRKKITVNLVLFESQYFSFPS